MRSSNVCERIGNFLYVQRKRKYKLLKQIGEGATCVVYRTRVVATGAIVAVKVIERSASHKLSTERHVLGRCYAHPSFVKLIEWISSPSHVYVVMELIKGGQPIDRFNLKWGGRYPEEDVKAVARQLLRAVEYLHDIGVCHRDLKLENLMFKRKSSLSGLKIIDFGLSREEQPNKGQTEMRTLCGTLDYLAPELVTSNKSYNNKVDIWSIGVIIYTLMSGGMPFYDKRDSRVVELIRRGVVTFPSRQWCGVSVEAKQFIRELLCYDPEERPTAAKALQHPWLMQPSHHANAKTVKSDQASSSIPIRNLVRLFMPDQRRSSQVYSSS